MNDAATELKRVLSGRVIVEPHRMSAYERDECVLTASGTPIGVVRARGVSDVVSTLQIASQFGTPVVPRGAGTGLAGGANAIDGGIVLDLSAMDSIQAIDPVARTATVEAGVINGNLDRAARTHGLFYAPDPGSRSMSTIGGNLATNAGGMCCVKYGATADHALKLDVVLANGDQVSTGSLTRKDVAGLNLTRLIVGSEGTLGVIVGATVRLLPTPSYVSTAVATFPTVSAAVDMVLAFKDATPSAVEIMDRTTIRAVNVMTKMGLDEDAGALVIIQCDGKSSSADIRRCAQIAQSHRAIDVFHTDELAEGVALMEARRVALTALERLGTVLLDDVCVPVHLLPALQTAIEEASVRHRIVIGSFGHAADGNMHPTIIFDSTDVGETMRAHQAFNDIIDFTIEIGGTVSGEHGIGLLKSEALGRQIGKLEIDLMRRVKLAFDPQGILNPGRGY